MWPFKKKQENQPKVVSPQQISYSQLDITEQFGDNLTLGVDDWIATIPLNASVNDPKAVGLPPVNASEEEVYRIAERMSGLRESVAIPNDGVYCPICHMANISLARLKTPCPKCQRPLLKFGWD